MYSSQFGPRGFEIFLLALNLIKTRVPNYTKKDIHQYLDCSMYTDIEMR